MYDYLNGYIQDSKTTVKGYFLTIDVADVGYLLEISEKDFVKFADCKEKQKFYISLNHKEDVMSLFGFSNKETRDIFQILISVSGVGVKMALALLNEFDLCDLITFVIDGNYKELTRAKGVGIKLAQKIILELKDKLIKTELPKNSGEFQQNEAINDVKTIMSSLGYNNDEIENALSKISSSVQDITNPEEILKKALMALSS